MKLVGLMLARNEDWIIGLSARVVLQWCDELVIMDHASTDKTPEIIASLGERVTSLQWKDASKWDEMTMRQKLLEAGRKIGGTHFAMIDADEILTANLVSYVRPWTSALKSGEVLELPMIPTWRNLYQYRDDSSVWSRAWMSLAFLDAPNMSWQPAIDGYQHHQRTPHGCIRQIRPLTDKRQGGVIHAQFANWERLVAKHVHYRMMEHIRWPDRMSVNDLNKKYNQALDENGLLLSPSPLGWVEPYATLVHEYYKTSGEIWYQREIERLITIHGRERFHGLDLKGY